MQKHELETAIRKILKEEEIKNRIRLNEQGGFDFEIGDIVGGQIAKTFVDPWVNVLKVIGYEITGAVSDVVLTLRLFVTFNNKKAEEIIARHNDRMQKLNDKRDKILNPLLDSIPGELHMLAFFSAPAAYMTMGVGSKVPGFARGTVDWLETTGIVDVRAGEQRDSGDPDRQSTRLEREREEQGPVKKALKALEQIFLLAHHETSGEIMTEAEEEASAETKPKAPDASPADENPEISKADIQRGLEENGILKLAEEYQTALKESTNSISEALKAFGSQVGLLGNVALSNNYDELEGNLSQIKSAIPDLDISELEKFKGDLQKAAESYAQDEEKIKEIATNILSKEGINEPTEEELANVDKVLLEKEVMIQVFYGSTSDLRSKIVNQLNESLAVYEEMMDNFKLPTGAPSEQQKLIDDSQYAKDIQANNAELNALKQKVSQIVGDIQKPAATPGA